MNKARILIVEDEAIIAINSR